MLSGRLACWGGFGEGGAGRTGEREARRGHATDDLRQGFQVLKRSSNSGLIAGGGAPASTKPMAFTVVFI